MKLVYMGTPQFAVRPLQALVQAGHEVVGVVKDVVNRTPLASGPA